jgi:MSHA pilin protein MshA
MKTQQKGFTLIELVVVIVLLGIIGAVATARFQDLAGDARAAAQQGIAAEIQSGSAINYAEGALDGSYTTAVANGGACTTAAGALLTSGVPTGWTISGGNIAGCAGAGTTTTTCTIADTAATLAAVTLNLICTS